MKNNMKSNDKIHRPVNTEFLKYMANDSYLNSKDVASIFNCSIQIIHDHMRKCDFPKPDRKGSRFGEAKRVKPNLWKKSTIVAYLKRLEVEK